MEPRLKPRCGLVGAGRTHNGLGPYLARDLEAAGAQVVAVAGRDTERTARAAAELADRLGHAVAAHASVPAMLAADPLDAMVVAAPIPAHLPALRAAVGAAVPVLCEKPLVAFDEHHLVPGLVEDFLAQDLLLMENCQLPYTLGAFDGLHPGWRDRPVERFEMHMAPTDAGRAMVVDTVSHFVSVLQGLLPVDASTRVAEVAISATGSGDTSTRVDVELESPFPRMAATLYLEVCAEQPRPQWIAVNGLRIERRIRASDYTMAYWSGDRCVPMLDPLAALAQNFVHLLREPDLDRIRAQAHAVRERARLYRIIVGAWGRRAR